MRCAATIIHCGLAVVCATLVVSTGAVPASTASAVTTERTAVIIQIAPGHSSTELLPLLERMGGTPGRTLDIINAQAAELPAAAIAALTDHPLVNRISLDHEVAGTMERTSAAIGATAIRDTLGYDGTGVGVALIDSGVTPWHDDLASGDGGQRVARFVDFVDNRQTPYDDYGHGTHVAGTIAARSNNSLGVTGAASFPAPGFAWLGPKILPVKVLNAQGQGTLATLFDGLAYAGMMNAKVANASLGFAGTSPAIDDVIFNKPGTLYVVSVSYTHLTAADEL